MRVIKNQPEEEEISQAPKQWKGMFQGTADTKGKGKWKDQDIFKKPYSLILPTSIYWTSVMY